MVDLGTLSGSVVLNGVEDAIRNLTRVGSSSGVASNSLERFAITGKQAKAALIGLSTAIVGISTAAIKLDDSLNKATNSLTTKIGASREEMSGLRDTIKEIYSENYGGSFEDIAEAIGDIASQMDLTDKELKEVTETALTLRDVFGFDVSESVRAADMLIKQFGVTAEEAYNIIAQGAQNGLDKNGNLLDSINEYSVHFKQLGLDANDMMNMFMNASEVGIFDVDKLGDAVKEFGIRAKDGSDTTIQAFEMLGLNADVLQKKFASGGEEAQEAFMIVANALIQCDDQVVQNTAGVNLFGTQFEDLGIKAISALTNVNGELDTQKDVLTDIKNIKYDDVASAFQGIGRQLQSEVLIPFGDKLLPYLNDLAQWIEENKNEISEGLGSALDKIADSVQWVSENLDTLIPIASAAVSGLIALKTVSTLVTAFNAAKIAVSGFSAALTFLEAHPVVLTITAIATAIGLIVAEVKKAEAQQRSWNDELQKTIDLKSDLEGGSTDELEEEKNVLEAQVKQYDELNKKLEENRQKQKDLEEAYSSMSITDSDFFAQQNELTQEQAKLSEAIASTKGSIEDQYGSLEAGRDRLEAYNERIKNAAEANKKLEEATSSEQKELIEQSQALEGSATKAELLYDEYQKLSAQTDLSKTDTERLKEVTEEIIKTMGSDVGAWNEVTQTMGINDQALKKAISSTRDQAKAKLKEADSVKETSKAYEDSAEAYSEASGKRLNLTKAEAEASLKAAEAQVALYEASGNVANEQYGQLKEKIAELKQYLSNDVFSESQEEDKTEEKKEDALKAAEEVYTQEKNLGKLSLREQLKRLSQLKASYSDTSEHIIEVNSFAQSEVKDLIEEIAEDEKLTNDQKITLYQEAKEKYCLSYSDKRDFTESINDIIKEDCENLFEDLGSLSDDDLEKAKETLNQKKDKYKDYAWAVEDLEEQIAQVKEEQASREIEQAKETVDELINQRKRLYDEQVDEIDKQSQEAIDSFQAELDAMEQAEENAELKKRDLELRERIASAETIEAKKEAEENYQEWLDKVDSDRKKKALQQAISDTRERASSAKDEAKNSYDSDIQSYNDFLKLEEEKIQARKENEGVSEKEISQIVANEYKQREKDLQEHVSSLKSIYESSLNELNSLNGTSYELKDYKTEYDFAEKAAQEYKQNLVTNSGSSPVLSSDFAKLLSDSTSSSVVQGMKEIFSSTQSVANLEINGDTLAHIILPFLSRESKRSGVSINAY